MRTAQVAAAPSTGGPGAASVPGQHLIDQGEHVVGLVVRVLLAAVVLVVIVAVLWQWWRATPRRGMANRWELRRTLSARSARRRMPQTRPSLAALPWRSRLGLAVTEYAVPLGRVVRLRDAVYATPEEQRLIIGPPRSGKTGELGNDILDAPGAVVVTSTKADLLELTGGLRAERGPVWVLNPEGLGANRWPSTLRWSPVAGCQSPQVARDRAGYLVAGAPVGNSVRDGNFWESTSATVLRSYLHAAALAGLTMRHVVGWVASPADPTPFDILRGHPQAADGWADELYQLAHSAEATAKSIWTTLGQALEFMRDPAVAQIVAAEAGQQFDVGEFLQGRGTLYLLGSDRPHGSLAPLFSAFCGHLFESARALAGRSPGGRLDPWLTLALDEAPLICPVPLDRWLPDSGGRGIRCVVVAQSRSQLYQRWGVYGGDTIWQMATIKSVLRGLSVVSDREDISRLCGEVDEPVRTESRELGRGVTGTQHSTRRVRVMAPEDVRMLRAGQQLLLHTGTRPALVSRPAVWDRRDVRAFARARRRAVPAEATRPAWVRGR
ncbi:MAG TPA: TraM recognition domain-containing protein [Mycobacteriales bacterium]